MRNLKYYWIIGLLSYGAIGLWGCATIGETAKGIAGISTKALEDGRKEAIIKAFNYDYNTCYHKVKEALREKGSYIYAEDQKKQMLAIYVSKEDTTPVGLFFKEIDAANTQIEVSSPSTYAKEFIATRVSKALSSEENEEHINFPASQGH